jgi:hypothetical protein
VHADGKRATSAPAILRATKWGHAAQKSSSFNGLECRGDTVPGPEIRRIMKQFQWLAGNLRAPGMAREIGVAGDATVPTRDRQAGSIRSDTVPVNDRNPRL